MLLFGLEFAIVAVGQGEMAAIRKSWWLSWDPGYLGGVGRLVIYGWGIEVHRTD